MTYLVFVGDQPREFLANADEKTERIVKDHLSSLADEPHPRPGAGSGDRDEKLAEPHDFSRGSKR